jgi:hypothetical protein
VGEGLGFESVLCVHFGQFAKDLLAVSTRAPKSGSDTDDSAYTGIESQIRRLTDQRDALMLRRRSTVRRSTATRSTRHRPWY